MRHLHRAQELLDSHGFGSNAGYPSENDFGGILTDWWNYLKINWKNRFDKEDRMRNLPEIVKGHIFSQLDDDDETAEALRRASSDYGAAGRKYFENEAKKRANDPGALLKAVKNDKAMMVDLLLKEGCKTDFVLLRVAVLNGNLEIVNLLLDNGEAGNIRGYRGWIVIVQDAIDGTDERKGPHISVLESLLEKGVVHEPEHFNEALDTFLWSIIWMDPKWTIHRLLGILKKFFSKGAKYHSQVYDEIKMKALDNIEPYIAIAELMDSHPENKRWP